MEIILSILGAVAVLKYSHRFFFKDTNELLDSMKFWFQPAKNRFMWGHVDGDFLRELRFFVWILLGIASGVGVHHFLVA